MTVKKLPASLRKYNFTKDRTLQGLLDDQDVDTWEITLSGANETVIERALEAASIPGATIFNVVGMWRGVREYSHIVKIYGTPNIKLAWFLAELAERLPTEKQFMVQRLTHPTEFIDTSDLKGAT